VVSTESGRVAVATVVRQEVKVTTRESANGPVWVILTRA
jgi:hypothetical protein